MPSVICRLAASLIVLLSLNRTGRHEFRLRFYHDSMFRRTRKNSGESSDVMEARWRKVARPGGLELPTFWFVARRSIQLSYGRAVDKYYHRPALCIQRRRESAFCTQFKAKGIRTNPAVGLG